MTDQNNPSPEGEEAPQETAHPLIAHLLELRDRLMKMIGAVMLVFGVLFWFRNDLYTMIARPLTERLPQGASMIATEVTSTFFAPLKLTLWLSLFIAIPVVLYHLWAFIAPGLYKKERRLVYPLLISSILLFFLGAAFAYYLVFPLVFTFFTLAAPEGVAVMTDISKYLDFVLGMFFAFGISFETPVVVVLLVWAGIVTPEALAEKRRYIVVLAFVIAMLLTPPDVISQIMLAIPLCLLFEVGLLISRLYVRKQDEEEIEEAGGDEPPEDQPPALIPRTFATPPGVQSVAGNPGPKSGADETPN
jgi:sec-independent protein translocase protein TatC